jgi:hypothetical protein
MKFMKKSQLAAVFSLLIVIIFVVGCPRNEQNRETYKATGNIDLIQETNATVDGIKTIYSLKLVNLEPGSKPDPKEDGPALSVSITKNTKVINRQSEKTEAASLKRGQRVIVEWRFASDHLTEAVQIIIQP